MSARSRTRFDESTYASGVRRYLSDAGEGAADLDERHATLFADDAIAGLRARVEEADGDEAAQARRLLAFAVDGHVRRATAELDHRIEAAEASAVVVWRGEPIPYVRVGERVAMTSDRIERNALEHSRAEAVAAINPLRDERLGVLRSTYLALGWGDLLEATREVRGFDPVALAVELQRFLTASETVYYAALRRYLALIDIEQGDGTDVDVRHLLRGGTWDRWFDARRGAAAVGTSLRRLGIESASAVGPGVGAGWSGWRAGLDAAGRAAAATAEPELPELADRSVASAQGIVLAELMSEPGWIGELTGMAEVELPGWLDFAAFARLLRMRRHAAMLLYELRLYREDDPAVARAYHAGVVGLLTGVFVSEASYLAPADAPLASADALRAELLAGSVAELLRQRHGAGWWRLAEAGATLRETWRESASRDAEAVVARLGYDRYDWRPVLRQIRTRLIGEMSGYGGPNITTRAGTRKV